MIWREIAELLRMPALNSLRIFHNLRREQALLSQLLKRHQAPDLETAQGTDRKEIVALTECLYGLLLRPMEHLLRVRPQVDKMVSPPVAQDANDFLIRILPKVSRTFALSIEALPESLRDAVRIAYLLCRVVDTIEDDADINARRRRDLFVAFRELLAGHGDPEAFRLAPEWQDERNPDSVLCRGSHHVFHAFRALEASVQDAIRPPILEMTEGMDAYTQRSALEGCLRIRTLEDLENYCYYVAGTVGRLLTDLFLLHLPASSGALRPALEARAVPFGLGLQFVNIIRDVATDLERGVCYLPEDLMAEFGLERSTLLDEGQKAARLALVGSLADRARTHLDQAIEYTLCWPAKDGEEIRFFCAVPLGLALGTLDRVDEEAGPGQAPKMDRTEVLELFARAQEVAGNDRALRVLFDALMPNRRHAPSRVGGESY